MIPKLIHYVWVGGNKKPKQIKKCMKTWEKLRHAGYEIIEWNESNFDINSHHFTKAAYKHKKWAFVSDYIRAYAIYNYGGIYLDTDVLILKDLEPLLNDRAFVGYESPQYPFTAVFGAEKNHPLVEKIINSYSNKKFTIGKNQDIFEQTNTIGVSDILIEDYNCQLGNKKQMLNDGIAVYPDYILCTPSLKSYAIHVFTSTWTDEESSIWRVVTTFLRGNSNNKLILLLLLTLKKIRNYLPQHSN